VLGEDVACADGLDEAHGCVDVRVMEGRGYEQHVYLGEVLDVLLEQDAVARLIDPLSREGEDITAIVVVCAPVYGEVGMAVKCALRLDADSLERDRCQRGFPVGTRVRDGDRDPVFGDLEFCGTSRAVGRQDELTGAVRGPRISEVGPLKWSLCS